MQTIAKHYSMVLEPEEKSHALRSRIKEGEEKCLKNLFNVHENQRATGTRYFSRRRNSSRVAYGDPYPYVETHECTIPPSVKSKNKKHWSPASNINTDNRRMTGNVNIYICSEANENGQVKGKPRLNARSCMDASSDASTELRSNSRCVSSGSSTLLRKPTNDVREKRQKPSNSIRNKRERNDDSTVRDTETWCKIRTTQTSDSNEDGRQMDVKLGDQEKCKDTILSARPSRDSANLYRDSSNSVGCDNFQGAPSWIAIHPSERNVDFISDDTDLCLSSVTDVPNGRKDRRENDDVCGITDSGCTDAIADDSGSLLKSAGTDCAACFADDSECRDVKFRDSISNCRDIRQKRMGDYKAPQQSIECNQGQQRAARQKSTCSCIVEEEEEEDCCTNVEKERPVNLRPTRVICSEPARDCATVISLNNAGDRFEKAAISKSISRASECPRAITSCGATLENSQEPPKVTRVSKKLVAQELPLLGIAVCKTIFAEPKEPPEEGMVCETAALRDKSDFEAPDEAPEETICKIPHSNFADNVEGLSANDAKDKLVKEKRDGTNLNDRKENVADGERATVQFADSSRNNAAPNLHLDRQQSANEYRRKKVSYKRSNDSPVSIRATRDFEPLSGHAIKFSRAVEFHDPSSYSTNSDAKGTLENPVDREKRIRLSEPLPRPMASHFQSVPKDHAGRDFTSTDSKQPKEKVETSKEEDDKKGSPDKVGSLARNPKDTPLYRSLKKLLDLIRHRKATSQRMKDGTKTEENRNDLMRKTQHDAEEDDAKPKIAGDVAFVERPTAIATTELSRGAEERDISGLNQTAPSKPKLLRIIAAKRSRLQPTERTADPKSREIETRVVSDEIATNERADRSEIPLEKPASVKITEDIIAAESTDISAPGQGALVQDASKNTVADTPEDMAVDENRVSEGSVVDEVTDARYPREKVEEAPRESVPCECGTHFAPNSDLRSVTERTECKDLLEDCFRRHKQSEAKEEECIRAPPCPKSRSKIDKLIFRSVSPSRVCTNCRETREECKQAVIRFHCCRHGEERGCDGCRCRRRDERCRGTERGRNCNRPMICLYCDNPRDECACKAPIGKCPRCGLPSDVCDRHDDARGHDRIVANKGGSLRVTSWKPKREVRRYFERNGSGAVKDCRCHEKPNRRTEELPYQRLNVFSDVMNELQRKMSESVCCTRWNTCCCCCCGGGARRSIQEDEGKERRRLREVCGYRERTKISSAISDHDRSRWYVRNVTGK